MRETKCYGENHPNAKLTWHDVELIRELREVHGVKLRDLAAKFEVTLGTISDILRYRIWTRPPQRGKGPRSGA